MFDSFRVIFLGFGYMAWSLRDVNEGETVGIADMDGDGERTRGIGV